MAYIQMVQFNPAKMGKRKGWCLANVDAGFGIKNGKFPSAKADMESQRKNGTLKYGTPPIEVSVPVYCDTTSKYEHVVVWHRGVVYEDGEIRNRGLNGLKVFGWGELCDGTRVVRYTSNNFLPPKGYWGFGDNDPRIGQLASFMRKTFPAYTPASALGNYYGKNIMGSIREFQRRCGLVADGNTGPLTYKELQKYGFKG